jgi:hypothetical protein
VFGVDIGLGIGNQEPASDIKTLGVLGYRGTWMFISGVLWVTEDATHREIAPGLYSVYLCITSKIEISTKPVTGLDLASPEG